MLNWLKSRLFWKAFSIYVLLSTLALCGLLLTLSQTIHQRSRQFAEDDARQYLRELHRSWPVAVDPSWLDANRRSTTLTLMLCDPDGAFVAADRISPADSTGAINESTRRILIGKAKRFNAPAVVWKTRNSSILCGAIEIPTQTAPAQFLVVAEAYSRHMATAVNARSSVLQAAIVTWICGTACMIFVVVTIVGPLMTLTQIVGTSENSLQRRDKLLSLQERNDEFGVLARDVSQADAERLQRKKSHDIELGLLKSRTTHLAAILQAMADGVVAVDQDEKVLFVNNVACQLLQVDMEKLKGRPLFEVARNRHVYETVAEALETTRETSVEFRSVQSNRDISLVVSPIVDGGAVLVLHDTTEVRQVERMRRDFVNGISHELKTPLTVIQACTETLLDGAIDDPESNRSFLQQIDEQSERLLQLVLGMLQLARVQSGAQVLAQEPVDLREVAETTLRSLRPVAEGRGITVSLEGEEELYVLGDYQALQTVSGSLLDNAIKYTPSGGWVRIDLVSEADALILRVSDNGVGIPLKDQVRIFERFYRVEKDRNRAQGGTGLGLAIVKHLCQAMRADIALESDTGKGCVFDVRFPVKDDADP